MSIEEITNQDHIDLREPIDSLEQKDVQDVELDCVVDSGAFTAWTKKEPIQVEEYRDFILQIEDIVDHYVNLDVIPGEFGTLPGPAETDEAAQQGWDNCKELERAGLMPMAVFHQGEDFSWLAKMVEEGYDYLGISPANDRSTEERIRWLDDVFRMLTNKDGDPIVRTHGLAATSPRIMERYPWYSCDSTSWRLPGDFGRIILPPPGKDGDWDYGATAERLTISPKSPLVKDLGKHFDNRTEAQQRYVMDYINHHRHDWQWLRDDYKERNSLNAKFWLRFEESLIVKPFKIAKPPGLFSHAKMPKVSVTKPHDFINTLP